MLAMIEHAPNATARRRAMRHSLKRGDEVACERCGHGMPAARAACAISHGLCVECNAPTLKHSDEARARLPEYETVAWSRGERLD